MRIMNLSEFKRLYRKKLDRFETHLKISFPSMPKQVSVLERSTGYSLFAGGKRIRPILLLSVVDAAGRDSAFAMPFACAIEYLHTYSLIHDDLPCMDDDSLRRGLPTNHVKFGEAIALLAGDALLTHSFYLIGSVRDPNVSADSIREIVKILAGKAGLYGMISGQVADVVGLDALPPQEALQFIHSNKTGALITASVQIGAILAGVDGKVFEALTGFGEEIGRCFQIRDDILDEIGSEKDLGKTPGTDKKNRTLTYPSIYGLEKSKQLAEESYQKAVRHLEQSRLDMDFLLQLANFIANRTS